MRVHSFLALFSLCLALISSCGKDDPTLGTPVQVSVDPNNPLLLKTVSPEGYDVHYYGDKDEAGKALSCNLITIQEPDQDYPITVQLTHEKPASIFGPDGSYMELIWEDDQLIRINATTPDNQYHVSVPLHEYDIDFRSTPEPRRGNLSVNVRPLASKPIFNEKTTTDVNIDVTQCGFGEEDALVRVRARKENGGVQLYLGEHIGGGRYQVKLSSTPDDWVDIQEICNSIESVLGGLCHLETFASANQILICNSIAIALDVLFAGPTGEYVPIFAACEAMINSLAIYCRTLNQSPGSGGPSVLSSICNSELVEAIDTPGMNYYLQTLVSIPGYAPHYTAEMGPFPIEGPIPDIDAALTDEPKVADFHTTPIDPLPSQGYHARGLIHCAAESTIATISVVGTDGYTDSVQVTLPAGTSSIEIGVPGAEAGVRDDLTIDVENGPNSLISIVF